MLNLIHVAVSVSVQVSFDFMTRELLWHGFSVSFLMLSLDYFTGLIPDW